MAHNAIILIIFDNADMFLDVLCASVLSKELVPIPYNMFKINFYVFL